MLNFSPRPEKGLVVLVCGGRTYSNVTRVYATLDQLNRDRAIGLIVQGGAWGADRLAQVWAKERNVACRTFLLDWARYGKRAGPLRNAQMLKEANPDIVVAFAGGLGTQHMMGLARAAQVPLWQIEADMRDRTADNIRRKERRLARLQQDDEEDLAE